MSVSQITLPPIPGPVPALPAQTYTLLLDGEPVATADVLKTMHGRLVYGPHGVGGFVPPDASPALRYFLAFNGVAA